MEPTSTRANRINSDSLDWSYIGISFTVEHSASARRAGPAIHGSFTFDTERMAAVCQRYAGPDASICEARASACVSTYSRMLVSLPSRTVMAKIQSSSNVLFVALIVPRAKPATKRGVAARPMPVAPPMIPAVFHSVWARGAISLFRRLEPVLLEQASETLELGPPRRGVQCASVHIGGARPIR